jgi:hypothetical protein
MESSLKNLAPQAITLAAAALLGLAYVAAPRGAPKPSRQASPGNELSVLSVNAYLIPWFYVYKMILEGDKFAIDSCKDQHARAKLLAGLAKRHDVLAIQEIWGGATDVLQREIEHSHWILPRYRAWGGIANTGLLGDYVNTLIGHMRGLGGLWFAACPASTSVVWSRHHIFNHKEGEEFMNKSVNFVLLDVSKKWGIGRKLLVVSTHLHSPEPFSNTKDRALQRKEISTILRGLPLKLKEENIDVDWSLCGGLLVGDLNTAHCIKGDRTGVNPTPEYLETLKEFDAIDLFLENDSFKSEEKGKFSYDGDRNSYVSHASRKDSSRMDYILALRSLGAVSLMQLRAKRCEIMAELENPCSDHYPLSVTIVPK